jgi:DNA (cytosine-5)-methyltransferase 1
VGENVRGLTNWNGGLVFDEVQTELEAEGYEVLPFLLPACAINAPHRRDRIWFVAYSDTKQREWKERRFQSEFINGSTKTFADTNSDGLNQCNSAYEISTTNGRLDALSNINESNGNGVIADTDITRIHEQYITTITNKEKQHTRSSFEARCFSTFPTEPPICGGDDGLPKELDNITFSKWRNESIKAYGNAIVPQVAYQIFKSICQYQEL